MKVEKISDTQIKFTLTAKDLVERDISISDLTYESEKTRLLFKEIIDEAKAACNFKAENTPLMIEAMPVEDGIMIIISKVKNKDNIKTGRNLQPVSLTEEKYNLEDFISVREKANSGDGESRIFLFSFDDMDAAANGAKRISHIYSGESALYRYKNEYFLILECGLTEEEELNYAETVMCEYGIKRNASAVSHAYLAEHGEVIIKQNAVNILSSVFA